MANRLDTVRMHAEADVLTRVAQTLMEAPIGNMGDELSPEHENDLQYASGVVRAIISDAEAKALHQRMNTANSRDWDVFGQMLENKIREIVADSPLRANVADEAAMEFSSLVDFDPKTMALSLEGMIDDWYSANAMDEPVYDEDSYEG